MSEAWTGLKERELIELEERAKELRRERASLLATPRRNLEDFIRQGFATKNPSMTLAEKADVFINRRKEIIALLAPFDFDPKPAMVNAQYLRALLGEFNILITSTTTVKLLKGFETDLNHQIDRIRKSIMDKINDMEQPK